MKTGLLIFWLLLLQALLCSPIALASSAKNIIVVKSSDNAYFNETINNLTALASKDIHFKVISSNDLNSEIKSVYEKNIFITLGIRATAKIIKLFPDQLIISTYSTREQIENLSPAGRKHLAILLDQPLERYLAFGHYLTRLSSPGIINNKLIKLTRQQKQFLKRLKLNLSQYQTQRSADLLPAIRHLKQQSDSLLMLPNHRLYNRDTLKGVLLTAYRIRMPIISYSPAHVKSGALASIYSSPEDIGRHLSELLSSNMSKRPKAGQTLHYARYYSIKTNSRVAHSLGFKIPSDSDIRQFLSKVLP